ncbi:D-alanyl-D-alanine carboxypeptidase/D-alanyl-D-alanine-endopeptidase [Bacillus sp. 7504-2]|nr:D-alanyl-D-alanine carboxypeptidase/D-alanyl-D-alanine-endopeptidase [Bacillus sp. 7504-2]
MVLYVLKGVVVEISVRSGSTGEVKYQFNGDTRLKPASNMKLITAAVALSVLGEERRFKTEVRTDGVLIGNTLKGDVYLIGKGDPTLRKENFQELARQLKEKGIKKIDGSLLGDDSWYDDIRLSQDMIWTDEESDYGAQVSALTASPNTDYDTGALIVEASPGKNIGDQAKISLIPKTQYVNIVNQLSIVSPEGKAEFHIKRKHGSNTIVLEGMLPIASPTKRECIAVWEPTGYALDLFQQALAAEGISLTGNVERGRYTSGNLVASHQSIPLSQLLVTFMKLSNNVHAEVLLKEMGKQRKGQGSWKGGLRVINEELEKFGVNTDTLVIRDGSGISHINLVTANEFTKLLFNIQKERWFSSYYESLPIAGKKSKIVGGTLRDRMAGMQVHAKTGTLTTVTAISGYVKSASGELLVFSILMNNLLDERKGKQVEDRLLEVIANQ